MCRSSAAALAGHALGEPTDVRHQLIDQRRLERQVLEHRLDRGPVLRDPLVVVRPGGLAPPLVRERRLQALDLTLEPPDARERGQARPDLARGGLTTLGQEDHVVERDLLVTDPIHEREQLRGGVGHAAEGPAQRDLADLDSLTDRDLLLGLEQGDLADLLQVEAHRILSRGGRRPQGRLGERRGLVQLDRGVHHAIELVVDRRRRSLSDHLGLPAAPLWLGGAPLRLARLDRCHAIDLSKGHYGLSCA